MRNAICAMVVVAMAMAASCRRNPPPSAAEPEDPGAGATTEESPTQAAHDIFNSRCVPCHGATGSGDGPASGSLNPHPRNFHDHTWQTAVSDHHIEQIIQFGGAAVGKSPAMPANPDLTSRPAVVAALRATVRSFGQQ